MENIRGIVFDMYGTLFDVHSVARLGEEIYPGKGEELSRLWRQKQLEYTWLRSLMGRYANFETVTDDALRFSCAHLGLSPDAATQQRLAAAYFSLSPFPDTAPALQRLQSSGLPMAILSNGSRHSIERVVGNAGLNWAFEQLISVEDVQVFKPDSRVYALAETRMGYAREDILFVSSNAWDASGAALFGFPVCWVDRRGSVFEELGARPKHVVRNLDEMAGCLCKG